MTGKNPPDPRAVLERPLPDGRLAGIDLPRGTIRDALDLPGDALDQCALGLGRAATVLPRGAVAPAQAAMYSAQRYLGQAEFVRQTGRGLVLCPSLQGEGEVTAAQLFDLCDKEDAYRGFSLLGERVATFGMDLRAVYGAYLWELTEQVLTYLEGRFGDATLGRAEEEELLDELGPALLLWDEALRRPPEQKAAYAELRGELGEALRQRQAEAELAEAELAVRQELPLSRQRLLAAARRHLERKGGASGVADSAGPAAEGRKLIR